MKKKDVDLFDKALHDVKTVIAEVKREKDKYHITLSKLIEQHDEEMEGFISQLFGIVDELNELVEDLIDGNDKEATK